MVFLYTNSKIYQGTQNNPDLSLGGLISSTIVPNTKLNNIFSDISAFGKQNLSVETKAIALKNTTGNTVNNVLLGFRYPASPIFKLEIAIVTLDNTNQFMEAINSSGDSPYNATFYEAFISDSEDHSLSLGSMINNAVFGIWVRRTILQQSSMTIDQENTFLKSIAQAGNPANLDNVRFILKYDTA